MNIAIIGYGLEGQANLKYWNDGANRITLIDENPQAFEGQTLPDGVRVLVGTDKLDDLGGYDMVVRTASLSPYKLSSARKIWSATNEFFAKCPALIVGVTGTKGKGTTSSMIASLLRADGRKVWLVGNIGVPALGVLPEIKPGDIVVYEMSSFQLWDAEKSPHIAVVLPIEPDHLNIHRDMDDYVAAKGNIRRFQNDGDYCVYYPDNQYSVQTAGLTDKGVALRYMIADDGGVYVGGGMFLDREADICPVSTLQLIGQHNVDNACAALTVARILGVPAESMERGLSSFQGLPHRLERVRQLDGVEWYNDSFSSAPGASIAAIRAFDCPEIVIIGGMYRGEDYSGLVETIKNSQNIKEVVLIGEVSQRLQSAIRTTGSDVKITTPSGDKGMRDIVEYCRSVAESGEVVVLSPGFGSFDMFKNFVDRGDQFRREVNNLS